MQLAKPALDVGLYTNNLEEILAFWQNEAHAPFSELLALGGGVRQYRHAVGDSVIKINHSRERIDTGQPTGLKALRLFNDHVSQPTDLRDPDGNLLQLCPSEKNRNLTLTLITPNVQAQQDFYGGTLGLTELAESSFAVGASTITLLEGELHPFERAGTGFRYMTFQVFDVVAEHQAALQKGGAEGMAPIKLGEVAYISFIKDADQNWLEISQRKSITGSLD